MPIGRKHYRVTLADALQAHEIALSFGGRPGVLDLGRVEAAIARPYSGYHRAIASKAAALFQAVANNHGFADGNKRTSIILTDLLIQRSGYRLVRANATEDLEAAIEELAIAVVNAGLEFDGIVAWFKTRLRRTRTAQG